MESRQGVGRGEAGGLMREDSSSFLGVDVVFLRGGMFCGVVMFRFRFTFVDASFAVAYCSVVIVGGRDWRLLFYQRPGSMGGLRVYRLLLCDIVESRVFAALPLVLLSRCLYCWIDVGLR